MKLVIQIPCYNEEECISKTIGDLPKEIKGISEIIILAINDGSTDKTFQKLKELRVDHIINFKVNKGLGPAFQAGLNYAKKINADLLINTDADNQYQSKYIPELVSKIINDELDIVIGARKIESINNFSWIKKKLQKIGSFVVRVISNQKFSDATSGFRIYSKKAIDKICITSKFSYTLESLIQSEDLNLVIGEIKIDVNPPLRKSRLFKSNIDFIYHQMLIIFRCFLFYKPLPFFSLISLPFFLMGILLIARFFIYYFYGTGGLTQSLVIGSMLIILSFICLGFGILGELIRHNRKINENSKL